MSAKRHGLPWAAGVDVGGTWIRVVALGQVRTLQRVSVPVTRVPELRSFLLNLWRRSALPRPAAIVVASRGIWTKAERQALGRRLRGVTRNVVVISDAQAALLGALGEEPGLLVLSGTGSIVLGRDNRGRWARAGGLGPLLGDEGSAFWIGREWLRATTEGEDFLPARRLVRAPDAVRRIAALAPRVFERARGSDPRARAIVKRAQDDLAALCVGVSRRLRLGPPVDVSWAGSVMLDDRFRHGVMRALARAGLRARWRPPATEPVVAAARLAARLGRVRTEPLEPSGATPRRPRRPLREPR